MGIVILDKQAMVAISKSGEQRREACLYRGKEEVGGIILRESPLEENKSSR